MLIEVYQAQSLRDKVLLNLLLALIASLLVATTAAAAADLVHEGRHDLNKSIIQQLLPSGSAASMPIRKPDSAWSGLPTNLSLKFNGLICRREYGINLNEESCLDAWRSIPVSAQLRTYGRRTRGKFEVPLPQRFLSGE